MNKRQLKKYYKKCIGETISLIYGTVLRNYLAQLYRTNKSYFEYFNKKKSRKVWNNIKHDSKTRPNMENDDGYIRFKNNIEDKSIYFIETYNHLKKTDERYENTPWTKPSTSWVVNYKF